MVVAKRPFSRLWSRTYDFGSEAIVDQDVRGVLVMMIMPSSVDTDHMSLVLTSTMKVGWILDDLLEDV